MNMKKNKLLVVGIDPGMQGGAALVSSGHSKAMKMSKDPQEVVNWISAHVLPGQDCYVFVERVSMWAGEAEANPGKAMQMQSLFERTQRMIGYMMHKGYKVVEVAPISWQSGLNLSKGPKGEEKKDRKNRYKVYAQSNHPDIRCTNWNCDAFCIGRFGAIKLQTDQRWINTNLCSNKQLK